MLPSRLAAGLVCALLVGCAASTPEPDPVAAPVVELDEPRQTSAKDTGKAPVEVEDDSLAEARKSAEALAGDDEEMANVYGAGISEEEAEIGGLGSATTSGLLGGGGTATGIGSLGTLGKGGGGAGFGSGHGRLGASRSRPVTSGASKVSGSLPKELIQRVVRRHINQIRYCYEKQLTQTPDLEGRIVVKFVIGKDGAVASADIKEAMQTDVDACVERVVESMSFPKPKPEGVVVVTYPFIFKNGDDTN